MDSEPRRYEIAYLISPDIPEDEVFGEAGKITGFIQDGHGLVGRIEEPKRRRLAYPIRKKIQAYFGWTTFTVTPERLAELEKRLRHEPAVLRYLVAEEARRPISAPQPRRAPRLAPRTAPQAPTAAPQPPREKEEEKLDIAELDKKLEEILGS